MDVSQFSPFSAFLSTRSVRGPFSVTITSCTFALNMDTRKEEGLEDRAIVKIAAHLPDLIVYGDFSPERPSMDYFDGVLMFVDISGKRKRGVQCG